MPDDSRVVPISRWDGKLGRFVERADIDTFLREVVALCRKHGFSVAHEDTHGSFEIHGFNDSDAAWLLEAALRMEPSDPKERAE